MTAKLTDKQHKKLWRLIDEYASAQARAEMYQGDEDNGALTRKRYDMAYRALLHYTNKLAGREGV